VGRAGRAGRAAPHEGHPPSGFGPTGRESLLIGAPAPPPGPTVDWARRKLTLPGASHADGRPSPPGGPAPPEAADCCPASRRRAGPRWRGPRLAGRPRSSDWRARQPRPAQLYRAAHGGASATRCGRILTIMGAEVGRGGGVRTASRWLPVSGAAAAFRPVFAAARGPMCSVGRWPPVARRAGRYCTVAYRAAGGPAPRWVCAAPLAERTDPVDGFHHPGPARRRTTRGLGGTPHAPSCGSSCGADLPRPRRDPAVKIVRHWRRRQASAPARLSRPVRVPTHMSPADEEPDAPARSRASRRAALETPPGLRRRGRDGAASLRPGWNGGSGYSSRLEASRRARSAFVRGAPAFGRGPPRD